jgi:DUF1680 family protein
MHPSVGLSGDGHHLNPALESGAVQQHLLAPKAALQRGPLVYGCEGLDNGGNPRFKLGADPKFSIDQQPDLLGGITVVRVVAANGQPIQAIPFCTMANRGKSEQEDWVEQPALKSGNEWWLGASYRPAP